MASAGEIFLIGRHSHFAHPVGMPSVGFGALATLEHPGFDRPVARTRDEFLVVNELDAGDGVIMSN